MHVLLQKLSKHTNPMFDVVDLDISSNLSGGTAPDDATSTTQVCDCDSWSIWLHYAGKAHSRLFIISVFIFCLLPLMKYCLLNFQLYQKDR